MECNIVLLTNEAIEKLPEIVKHRNENVAFTKDFKEYGLNWPLAKDFQNIKKQVVQLGWHITDTIAFVVIDEKQWTYTRLKYGI